MHFCSGHLSLVYDKHLNKKCTALDLEHCEKDSYDAKLLQPSTKKKRNAFAGAKMKTGVLQAADLVEIISR